MTRRLLIATAILFFGHAWRTLVRPDLSDAEIASLATAQLRDDGRSLVALQTIQHAQHWREMILPFGAALLVTGLIAWSLSRSLFTVHENQHEN